MIADFMRNKAASYSLYKINIYCVLHPTVTVAPIPNKQKNKMTSVSHVTDGVFSPYLSIVTCSQQKHQNSPAHTESV